ncbi:hypothetical protein FA95DRAFT_222753 [Auriscalpium vulgare]|uniref:Uncharacterized protein n=1 Tax=Auriscalpium vulgare TaxID=40419 RepID=A0ACB8RLF3_9AGAM|nr:hypothetical protein FA95DRAFT_222753 [Auriscalpium vulgare]
MLLAFDVQRSCFFHAVLRLDDQASIPEAFQAYCETTDATHGAWRLHASTSLRVFCCARQPECSIHTIQTQHSFFFDDPLKTHRFESRPSPVGRFFSLRSLTCAKACNHRRRDNTIFARLRSPRTSYAPAQLVLLTGTSAIHAFWTPFPRA